MDFQSELMWRDRSIRIASVGRESATADRYGLPPLPGELLSLAEHAERLDGVTGQDLAVSCTDVIARKLTSRMWQRAHELAGHGRLAHPLPDDVGRFGRELSPQAVVEVLGAVVRSHLEYDHVLAARRQAASGFPRLLEAARLLWALRGRRAVRLAQRVTGRGVAKGVCTDYATAMRTLFYALKRATGAPRDAFVVEILGEAFGPRNDMHAWNWLIDGGGACIAAFDASRPRARRGGLAIDLQRYHNASAFLATAVLQATRWNGLDPGKVAELLAATVDPESDRGQTLLFGIADHVAMSLGIRARLAEHLAARRFERLLPDWSVRLARRTAYLGSVGRRFFAGSERDRLPLALLRLADDRVDFHPYQMGGYHLRRLAP